MKKIFITLFTLTLLFLLAINFDYITDAFSNLLRHNRTVIITEPNLYHKNTYYKFVKQSEDYIPYSRQDLVDIFFSILNNGYEKFTFYCPSEYKDCIKDVNSISSSSSTLTHINNFVDPFNNFSSIKVTYDETGEITVEVTKSYTEEEIIKINEKVDEIINKELNSSMTLEEKILKIHDHIINITKYDQDRLDGIIKYKSNIAYGPLLEGYGICGGYSDAMAIFLNRWNVPNFKVASNTHIWNAVYINNKWLHLDLTWDDPVSINSDKNNLIHKFYLIDTETLESYNIDDHEFDKIIYQELLN
ncbi:MAG TPA: hypothetical protein GX713_02655 [Mollicutes bacterium]|nr:hypothetical protein [Mollicutes bacterium]